MDTSAQRVRGSSPPTERRSSAWSWTVPTRQIYRPFHSYQPIPVVVLLLVPVSSFLLPVFLPLLASPATYILAVKLSQQQNHAPVHDTTTMSSNNYTPDVEKDHAGGGSVNGAGAYDLHHDHHDEDTALRRLRTAGSLSISPELFEKIYLSPKNQVSNNIRSTFGNPTPL